ncbi:type I polyketide synthase [Niveispirillum sp. KHB5.9]|uniref:type I polyketide synthase n=1 Tax=Niveispirillum sp. KHB5.9 TaxID=3400269 RepID=UPI003A893ADE
MTADNAHRELLTRAAAEIKALQARLDAAAGAAPIAVIGAGCRFPGGADGVDAYWHLLRTGGDGIRPVPDGRWDMDRLYDPEPGRPGRLYTRAGGFLDDVDRFDAGLFDIPDAEADSMDPQQRLVLETGWAALEHAGIAPATLRGSRTGVFVGIGLDDYARLMQAEGVGSDRIDPYRGTGTGFCFAAGRLSYVLGLQGPSLSLDTACSSSLVAAHLACQSLRAGECDMALAGGVNLVLSPDLTIYLCGLRALAPDGRSKTFDASADGYGRGEGAGFVVLKRLDDALAAGDRVLAVIRGSAVNHDGASSGLTVPNGEAQQAVIRAALAQARVEPAAVTYVETHGTGTSLGDPIEVAALGAVYGPGRERLLHLGAVKAHIGHLEPAAGVAGLIKLALSLHHATVPPQRPVERLNPAIDLDAIKAGLAPTARPWTGERLGAISAFGLSGTNAHMVLEGVGEAHAPATRHRPVHVLALAAGTTDALTAQARALSTTLATAPDTRAADLSAAISRTRNGLRYRRVLVGTASEIASAALSPAPPARTGAAPQVAFLFSGQGAQYAGMGRGLYETEPVFRAMLDRCDAICAGLGVPLLDMLHPADPADRRIDHTSFTQPALFSLSVSLLALWRSWGVNPAAVMGHSVGEFAAAHAAGVLGLEEALALVVERGRLMGALPLGGAMAAVAAGIGKVRPLVDADPGRLAIAGLNAPDEVVISGAADAVRLAGEALRADGVRVRDLTVSHAFHSPLMDPVVDAFAACAAGCDSADPAIALVSNVTGTFADAGLLRDPAYWGRHLRQPVRFADGMAALIGAGCTHFVEIGPGAALLGLGRRVAGDGRPDLRWLPSLRSGQMDARVILGSLGALYEDGASVDWAAVHRGFADPSVRAPTYPFQRKRHWFRPGRARAEQPQAKGGAALVGSRHRSPARTVEYQSRFDLGVLPILGDHVVYGRAVVSGPTLVSLMMEAARDLLDGQPAEAGAIAFLEPVILTDTISRTVSLTLAPDGPGRWRAELQSLIDGADDGAWTLHATAIIAKAAAPADTAPSLEVVRARCPDIVTGKALYDDVQTRVGFTFGRSYLWVDTIWRREGEAIGRMRAPEPSDRRDGSFAFHPGLHDSCYQVFGAASQSVMGTDLSVAVIPVGVDSFRFFGDAGGDLVCHAVLWPGEAGRDDMFAGDFTLYDAAMGRVVAEARGLRLRRARRDVMMRALSAGDAGPLYRLDWKKLPPPVAARAGRWLLVGDDASPLADALRAGGAGSVQVVSAAELPAALANVADGVAFLPLAGGDARAVIEPALAIVRALAAAPGTPRLWLVTRDGDLSHATLWGLGAVAALELPDRWGGLVDLAGPGDWRATAAHLLAGGVEDRVRIGEGGVEAARLLPTGPAGPAPAIRADANYLITGGLGELGLATAEWLVRQGARHITLTGRRGGEVPASLTAAGADIRIVAADVTDRAAMADLLGEMDGVRRPALAGLFHAAGTLADRTLTGLDWAATEPVLSPKLNGALILDALTRDRGLDLFVCYSSGASLIGSPGQGNYAAANAGLDALCRRRAAAGLPALSINWGPWAGGGMAAVRDDDAWTARGVRPFTRDEGMDLIGRALSSGLAQVAALPVDWGRYLSGAGATRAGLFDAVRPKARLDAGTKENVFADWQSRLAAAAPERRREMLEDMLRPALVAAIGLPAGMAVPARQGFFDLGMDSLMAIEFRNRLQSLLGRPLPATLILDRANLHALAGYLLEHLFALAESAGPAPVAAAVTDHADLDMLSDDELTSLLIQELEDTR